MSDGLGHDGHPDAALISALRGKVLATFEAAIGASRPVALIDFPFYPNVGDSLIYLSEVQALRALNRWPACYTSTVLSYQEGHLRHAIGDGVILLQGGGNFGDLYPQLHGLRERIIEAFPDNRIVQLPQSICFRSDAALQRTIRIVNAHPALTLLFRDHRSYAFAQRHFKAPVVLCPDTVFALEGLPRRCHPTTDVMWLKRTDTESAGANPIRLPEGHRMSDWRTETAPWIAGITRYADRAVTRYPNWAPAAAPLKRLLYEQLALVRMRRGSQLLGQGRVVITDRLHGHLLAMLLGIPHALLDSSDGKVSALHETWTSQSRLVRVARDASEAIALANEMLSDTTVGSRA